MQLMMSFVGGLMLGVAILHLLPHAVVETNELDYAAWSCMLGLLTMFLIIRVFNVHQHGPVPDAAEVEHAGAHAHHAHHDCEHPARAGRGQRRRLSWVGLFFGLAVHSVIDGVAVAASVVAAASHDATLGFLGAGTFLAVLFHKPLDSLSITSVMAVEQWSRRACNVANLLFSLICPVGALLFFFGTRELGAGQHVAVGCALGFSAGVFLCISLADILPEIQFHHHDRASSSATLLLGVVLSFAIGFVESDHAHDRPEANHESHEPHEPHE